MRRDPNYRYLINHHPDRLEVHDLDNEKTGPSECQINEIRNLSYITTGNTESDLRHYLQMYPAYDGCKYCLPNYHRK